MATTTTTTVALSALQSTPSSIHLPSESSTSASLRTLYQRAAKAFLQRDLTLTFELVSDAFGLLTPPESPAAARVDALVVHRRKWDILRITLETTAHAAPDSGGGVTLPAGLRASLALMPQALLGTLHSRSLRLFTPSSLSPSAAWLPTQVVLTLAFGALKLGCPQVARSIIEEWLARRTLGVVDPDAADGYEKILEVYCVHVLPRMEDWVYAKEFLSYETELAPERRELLIKAVDTAHAQHLASNSTLAACPTPTASTSQPENRVASSSRATSPARSTTSSASTQTARPISRNGLQPMTPLASTTSTPRGRSIGPGRQKSKRPNPAQPAGATAQKRSLPHPQPPRAGSVPLPLAQHPTSLTVASSTFGKYASDLLRRLRESRSAALFLAFAVLPLLSFLLRIRHTGRRLPAVSVPSASKRLRDLMKGGVQAVVDTVSMAGKGLV